MDNKNEQITGNNSVHTENAEQKNDKLNQTIRELSLFKFNTQFTIFLL